MLVRARIDKAITTRQEYPNGKGTKERDEETGVHKGVVGMRQQKDGEFMVGTYPLFMSRPRGRSKSLGEQNSEGIGGCDGSTLT